MDSGMTPVKNNSIYLLTIPRPVQREVIVAALDGHDVFLQAATSFGKSLCFQLPAVVDFGSKRCGANQLLLSRLIEDQSHHRRFTIACSDGTLT